MIEQFLAHLGLQPPRVDIILEVKVLMEHLADRSVIASHFVQENMLLCDKLVLHHLLV